MSLYLFDFKEGIASNYLTAIPFEFKISTTTNYDILVLRMLTCNIDILRKKDNSVVKLQENYTAFPYHIVKRKSSKQMKNLLKPYTLKDYVKFSQKYYSRNVIFYHNLLQELVYYFYYSNIGQYQAAFVNLYRILEYVSYTFPLMHASHFGNYMGSFEALRGYFTDAKTSELAFFEKFVTTLYRGTSYLSYTTDFDFSHTDINIANNCYDALFRLVKNSNDWIVADRATHTLAIENKNVIKLFKDCRNRYFHFAVGGQRNIQNIDLKDPDFFFQQLNSKFLNWISYIYGTVVRESIDNAIFK